MRRRLRGAALSNALAVTSLLCLINPVDASATCSPFTGALARPCDITCVGATCRQPLVACDGADSDGGAALNDGFCVVCGNSSANVIVGGTALDATNGVKDYLCGAGGDDTISSLNAPYATVGGGPGNDTIVMVSSASNYASGGTGDDTITASAPYGGASGDDGNDTINLTGSGQGAGNGGAGDDTISGGAGDDSINGEDGEDILDGGDGDNLVGGGDDDDIVRSGSGNDSISGGEGNDSVDAGGGDNEISGGDGDDLLIAGSGDDTIRGGRHDDSIYGGGGADYLTGEGDLATIVTNKIYVEGDDPVCATTPDYMGATLCNASLVDACGYGHQCIGHAINIMYTNLGSSAYDVGTSNGFHVNILPGSDSLDSRQPGCGCS